MCKGSYSPKIAEDLIPVLFGLALQEGVAMTRLVDDIIRTELHIRGVITNEQAQKNTGKRINQ